MATTTKTRVTVESSVSVSAGGSETSASQDISTGFGSIVSMQVTNGATGPTIGCTAEIQVQHTSAGTWYTWRKFIASNGDSDVSQFTARVPPEVYAYRTHFEGHTGQAVTVEADAVDLDSIS